MSLPPFQTFLDGHRDEVWRFLLAVAGPERADDCFQETFISALRAYPRLEDGSKLRAWILTIAQRKAIDAHRTARRGPVPMAEPPEPEPRVSDGGRLDAWELVRQLPPKQRAAVTLRYLGDLRHAEIGRALECSPQAARRSVHDGLERLRDLIERTGVER